MRNESGRLSLGAIGIGIGCFELKCRIMLALFNILIDYYLNVAMLRVFRQ